MTTAVRITDRSTRADVEEALRSVNAKAMGKPHVFGVCAPSAWDELHDMLDHLLADWERADA